MSIPVFFGATLNQITVFIDKLLATWLAEGSIAVLNYGLLVQLLFIELFGGMIATYLYPKMAQAYASHDIENWKIQFNNGVGMLFVMGIPLCIGSLVFSNEIIQLIFERGAFDSYSTQNTAAVFFFYSIGTPLQISRQFLIEAHYSIQDTKTPFIVSAISATIKIIGNLVLINAMGLRGIALSTGIAFFINSAVLLTMLCKRNPGLLQKGFIKKIFKICSASAIAVTLAYVIYKVLDVLPMLGSESSSSIMQLIHMGIVVIITVVIYIVLIYAFKVDESRYLKQFVQDVKGMK
jgi:putative peptidoglycan lipid II flippase